MNKTKKSFYASLTKTIEFNNPTLDQKLPFEYFMGRKEYLNVLYNNSSQKGIIQYKPYPKAKKQDPEEVIFRQLAQLKVASVYTLSDHTEFSVKDVRTFVSKLVEKEKVLNIGHIMGPHAHQFSGDLYAIKYAHTSDPYYTGDLFDTHVWGYSRERENDGSEYYHTSCGFRVKAHLVGGAQACGKIVAGINKLSTEIPCLNGEFQDCHSYFVYSEHALRSMFGWFHPDTVKPKPQSAIMNDLLGNINSSVDQPTQNSTSQRKSAAYRECRKLFATYVPDFWLVGRGSSLRIEYIRSAFKPRKLKESVFAAPDHEMILCLIEACDADKILMGFDGKDKRTAENKAAVESLKNSINQGKLLLLVLPRNHDAADEARFQNDLKVIFKKLRKNSHSRRINLPTPDSGAPLSGDINIMDLTLHYSQGPFLCLMKKESRYSRSYYGYYGHTYKI